MSIVSILSNLLCILCLLWIRSCLYCLGYISILSTVSSLSINLNRLLGLLTVCSVPGLAVAMEIVETPADLRRAMNNVLRKQRSKINRNQQPDMATEEPEEEKEEEEEEEETESKVQKIVIEDTEDKKVAYYTKVDAKRSVCLTNCLLWFKLILFEKWKRIEWGRNATWTLYKTACFVMCWRIGKNKGLLSLLLNNILFIMIHISMSGNWG